MKQDFIYFLRYMQVKHRMTLRRECIVPYAYVYETLRGLNGFNMLYVLVKDNEPLYIGVTNNLFFRMPQHVATKDFDELYFVILSKRVNMYLLEKRAIMFLRPKLNKVHNSQKIFIPIVR